MAFRLITVVAVLLLSLSDSALFTLCGHGAEAVRLRPSQSTALLQLSKDWSINNSLKWPNLKTANCKTLSGVTCNVLGMITGLDVSNSDISGTISKSIGLMWKLRSLNLHGNDFHGTFPRTLAQLLMLRTLNLSSNNFDSADVASLAFLKTLRSLDLSGNQLTVLPARLTRLRLLTQLSLAYNSFNASVLPVLKKMRQLSSLDLSSNKLSGSLASFVSTFVRVRRGRASSRVRKLKVSHNNLDGPLPLVLPPRLLALDVSDNSLSGVLPNASLPSTLQYLSLAGNSITGPIPDQAVSGLNALTTLDVQNNYFTGSIPELPSGAKVVLLHGNFFTGGAENLPSGICSSSSSAVNIGGNCLAASVDTSKYPCLSSQAQRSSSTCNVSCALPCPDRGSCFLTGANAWPMCSCGRRAVASSDILGACSPLYGNPLSFCLTPNNYFLQQFTSFGSALPSSSLLTLSVGLSPGALFLPSPIRLFSTGSCNPLSFSATFSFTITSFVGAGGFTFSIVTSPGYGTANGHLGMNMSGPAVAIEFDVNADLADASFNVNGNNHVGIDLNGSPDSATAYSPSFDLKDGQPKHAWVDFEAGSGKFSAYVAQTADKPTVPLVSMPVSFASFCSDPSGKNPVYVGFTGDAGNGSPQLDSIVINEFCLTIGSDPAFAVNQISFDLQDAKTPIQSNKVVLVGDASLSTPSPELNLMQPSIGSLGYAFFSSPFAIFDAAQLPSCVPQAWSTSFTFLQGEGPGFTFSLMGTPSAYVDAYSLGFGSTTDSLAIEFDTEKDDSVSDPDGNHIGLDLDGSAVSVSTSSPSLSLSDYVPKKAWIDFLPATNTIKVYVSSDLSNKPSSPVYTATSVDVCSALNPNGHAGKLYVGFTSAVFTYPGQAKIRSWCFSATGDSSSFCTSDMSAISLTTNYGAAVVPPALSLTSGFPSSIGAAYVNTRLPIFPGSQCSSISFNTFFMFETHHIKSTGGAGMTFTLMPYVDSFPVYPGDANMGYGGAGPSFAIELDMYQDVSVGDPVANHIGVDMGGDMRSVMQFPEPDFAVAPQYVWIDFVTDRLDVYLSTANNYIGKKPFEPWITTTVALCSLLQPALSLGYTDFYFGMTAGNRASASSVFNIYNWTLTANFEDSPSLIKSQSTGLLVSSDALTASRANKFFRYASAGYDTSSKSWAVEAVLSWVNVKNYLTTPGAQGDCGSCWAYAVTSCVEGISAIAKPGYGAAVISPNQLLTSAVAAGGSCGGGTPANALAFLVDQAATGLGLVGKYDYLQSSSILPLLSFDRASLFGWFGILLAVQRQPVIVHIEARASSFLNYDGVYVYRDPACYTYNLNHAVVVVGYVLDGIDPRAPGFPPPYWLIRNSWGSEWGEGGYMRMAMQGGDGVCGINTLPALVPVIKSDPCWSSSLTVDGSQPYLNPCGAFTCTVDPDNSTTNVCACQNPFVMVTNTDGTRTCAYIDACGSSFSNPCAVGSCINDGQGSYSCICPPGFYLGTTIEGEPSCSLADNATAITTYTTPTSGITCEQIYPVYGLDKATFLQQNPSVSCASPLAAGTTVSVVAPSSLSPCTVIFTAAQGDTCSSVQSQFNLTTSAFSSINPGIDCAAHPSFDASQVLCLERDPSKLGINPPCTATHRVQRQETCDYLRTLGTQTYPDGTVSRLSWLEFYRLNPGIVCTRLTPPISDALVGAEVCLAASTGGSTFVQGGCGAQCKLYSLPATATCANLRSQYFKNSQSAWNKCNKFQCVDIISTHRSTICIPK